MQNQDKISFDQLAGAVSGPARGVELSGLSDTAAAFSLRQIYRQVRLPMVVLTADLKQAERLVQDLDCFFGDLEVEPVLFPPYTLSPYNALAYHNETAWRRIGILYRLLESRHSQLIVTTITAAMQQMIPKAELVNFAELVIVGEELDRDGLIRKLVAGGYNRAMLVEEPGDFAVRGGIIDVFAPIYPDPLRLEFFGDQLESLRFFSPASQRTTGSGQEAVILPAREAVVDSDSMEKVLANLRLRAAQLELPLTTMRRIARKLKEQGGFEGIESLTPLIYSRLDTLFDYVTCRAVWVVMEPAEVKKTAQEFFDRTKDLYQRAVEDHRLCVAPDQLYLNWHQVMERFAAVTCLACRKLPVSGASPLGIQIALACHQNVTDNEALAASLKAAARQVEPFGPLIEQIQENRQDGISTLIACRRKGQVEHLHHVLSARAIEAAVIDNFGQVLPGKGRVYLGRFDLDAGFCWPQQGLAVITAEEIFGVRYSRPRKARRKARDTLLTVEDLRTGDLVVHDEHGIGRYQGLVKLALDGAVNDYLLIVYQDDDKLYVPVDRLELVQKYMGVEGIAPVLDKMGGKSWQKVKSRVRRSTEKIAGELLKLYAARKVRKGYAFGVNDSYFKEFEAGFPYEETEDQRRAIEDVLNDMRKPAPMDRLVCGDVGYGKTEVALRAAFLAVSEAKQVAVLVPTTVLAEQHWATFCQRFQRYPVRIECLSRFRSRREQKTIVSGLADGTVDIVIGTHRLLQKDVSFKDLGLLVLDEEQRFGVKHKERIKQLRSTVDVLTLTATPIPRTLHLSLIGVRDISVISTPPELRQPIVTYIAEFDPQLVAEAIRRELGRGGQIFFVHNVVNSIEAMAARLKQIVPEVRLAVAHGQMGEESLEQVMMKFVKRRIDMLVCTTIIESGLDVPAANTILINRADRFGLSQMYQLRGRVGRSDQQAYAYLFIPEESSLTRDARKRLKVLMEHSDLGAGFQIAMSDLKIRGGGTILGSSQSGHIAAVGYDMFLKLMESSIAQLKGQPLQEPLEPEVNLPLATLISADYIPDIDQRLSVYRKLARLDDVKDVAAAKREMLDRFGPLPEEARNMLLKIMLKILARKAGCRRLDIASGTLVCQFSPAHQKRPQALADLVQKYPRDFRLAPNGFLKVRLKGANTLGMLSQTKKILNEIIEHVNS